jgi:hypothetical protein
MKYIIRFLYFTFLFINVIELNAQTTKNVELCFYDYNGNPLNEVMLTIDCSYCDSLEKIYTDTCCCINYNFICDKIYMIIASHPHMFTIKEYIKNPCELERKEYHFEKIITKYD